MLAVVKDKQSRFFMQGICYLFAQRAICSFSNIEDTSDCLRNKGRVRKRIQGDEPNTTRIMMQKVLPYLQRQARFSNAARPSKRDQAVFGKQLNNLSLLFFTTDKG